MNQSSRRHHTIDDSGILIDGFRFAREDVTAYVLSHYHSDHYAGLESEFPWDNARGAKLWCTPVTAALVASQLRVRRAHIVAVPFDTPVHPIPGMTLTFIISNHCPGAAMMLVEWRGVTRLHCGDARWHPAMRSLPLLARLASTPGSVDELLLDTTYAHPKHDFPPQAGVVNDAVALVRGLLATAAGATAAAATAAGTSGGEVSEILSRLGALAAPTASAASGRDSEGDEEPLLADDVRRDEHQRAAGACGVAGRVEAFQRGRAGERREARVAAAVRRR
jgi:hypothetical protein